MDNVEASGRCCAGEECREDVCPSCNGRALVIECECWRCGEVKSGVIGSRQFDAAPDWESALPNCSTLTIQASRPHASKIPE
jgi:hypothetical protein